MNLKSSSDLVSDITMVLNAPVRDSPIAMLSRVKYPHREILIFPVGDNTVAVNLFRYGYNYKFRGDQKPPLLPIDTKKMREAFQKALPNYIIKDVADVGKNIILYIQEEQINE